MRQTLASARPFSARPLHQAPYTRRSRLGLLATLVAITTAIVLLFAPGADAQTDLEQCFLDKINDARAAVGAGALEWADEIADYTRDHSAAMASTGGLYHSTGAQLDAVLPDSWSAWGENVGYISVQDCDGMHQGFMESDGHRENLLNPVYDFAATGAYIDSSGWLWTTHVFFAAADYDPSPGNGNGNGNGGHKGSFADDDGSTFEQYIESLVAAGITNGCGNASFCPKDTVNREQMAAFLNRALDLPDRGEFGFRDVNRNSTFFDDINAIANAGITNGCGNNRYCPNQGVTRSQMAAFLVRALGLPDAPHAGFADVGSGHPFADDIASLSAAGITNGCGNNHFCPDDVVNREQMAAFLVRALDL